MAFVGPLDAYNSQPIQTKVGTSQTNIFTATSTKVTKDSNGKVNGATTTVYYSASAGNYVPAATTTDGGKTWTYLKDSDGKEILGTDAKISLEQGALKTNTQQQILAATKQRLLGGGLSPEEQKIVATSNENTATELTSSELKTGEPTEIEIITALTSKNIDDILGTKNLIYPTTLSDNGQDFISFGMFEYTSKSFTQTSSAQSDSNSFNFKTGDRNIETPIGPRVYLPIQPTISDQNDIVWGEDRMTPIQAYFADKATTGNLDQIFNDFTAIDELVGNNSPYGKILRRAIGGAAVGINPIARTDGLVINPNLELLFSGPTLRPFNFTFRLSPRDKDEAKIVKTIIKLFKLGSTVRTTNDGLFLKAPYVFKINYSYSIKTNDKTGEVKNTSHPGLNAIKTCALKSVNVNYTPDGSYMTFEDGTMTSYELSLQFMELEPVYDSDYKDKFKYENYQIGY